MELLEAPGSLREQLKKKFVDRTALIGVAGIGYVGLPLAVEKAKVGFEVIGYDRNSVRVDQVNQGLNYIRDVERHGNGPAGGDRQTARQYGFQFAEPLRRDRDLRSDAAHAESGSRHLVHQSRRRTDRRAAAAGTTRVLGEHHVSGHDGRSAAAAARAIRPKSRRRFLSVLLARARRPRQRALHDQKHEQGRRRRDAGVRRRRQAASISRRSSTFLR